MINKRKDKNDGKIEYTQNLCEAIAIKSAITSSLKAEGAAKR